VVEIAGRDKGRGSALSAFLVRAEARKQFRTTKHEMLE